MIFLWIILYGTIYFGAEQLSNLIGIEHIVTSFALLIYAVLLILYYKKSVNFSYKIELQDTLYLLPLLFMPILNLIVVKAQFSFFVVLLMLSVCVIEEVFFRGILLDYFKIRFKFWGVILSSLLFALFHVVNVINYDVEFVLVQISLSFAVGVLYSGIALKLKSILFGVLSHFLTNVTGIGYGIKVSVSCYYVLMVIAFVVTLTYGVWITLKNKKQTL